MQLAELRDEIDALMKPAEESASTQTKARGEVRGIDKMNNALWRMGALKHTPPSFKYFDPQLEEQRAVVMKEVKLPRATETHELCYEPVTRCLFVSQMSNSVLVRIPVGADGLLLDDQDAWNVGPQHPKTGDGLSGLHSLTRSTTNPGCLWLTLQFANTLVLLDAATMGIRQLIKCPQLFTRPDGTLVRIGGPHCVLECAQTGALWVALKGSVPCHPGATGSSQASLASAIGRVCCNPQAIKERMQALAEAEGKGAPAGNAPLAGLPEGFAIWRIHPSEYDPKAAGKEAGGKLFECEPSPPMVAIDNECNCWVVQDKTPAVMKVNSAANTTEQIPVPLGSDIRLRMTGPAIMTAPDGAVWATLLGADGGLVRFCPATGKRTLYQLPAASLQWMHVSRFIHMRFATMPDQWAIFNGKKMRWPDGLNVMYLISSNLVDDTAMNAITAITFIPYVGSGWVAPMMRKDIPLPTQDCCCHRIEIITDGPHDERISAVVSELSSSRVFQIQLKNLEIFGVLSESISTRTTSCGAVFNVLSYAYEGCFNGKLSAERRAAFVRQMGIFRAYYDAFPPDDEGGEVMLPSLADAKAKRQFDSPAQQQAFDDLIAFYSHTFLFNEDGSRVWVKESAKSVLE